MGSPAAGAKLVTTVLLGAVGAGVFAGVSHDGRGVEPIETETTVDAPPSSGPTSVSPSTVSSSSASTSKPAAAVSASIDSTTATSAAEPAPPDTAPRRSRVRSGGS